VRQVNHTRAGVFGSCLGEPKPKTQRRAVLGDRGHNDCDCSASGIQQGPLGGVAGWPRRRLGGGVSASSPPRPQAEVSGQRRGRAATPCPPRSVLDPYFQPVLQRSRAGSLAGFAHPALAPGPSRTGSLSLCANWSASKGKIRLFGVLIHPAASPSAASRASVYYTAQPAAGAHSLPPPAKMKLASGQMQTRAAFAGQRLAVRPALRSRAAKRTPAVQTSCGAAPKGLPVSVTSYDDDIKEKSRKFRRTVSGAPPRPRDCPGPRGWGWARGPRRVWEGLGAAAPGAPCRCNGRRGPARPVAWRPRRPVAGFGVRLCGDAARCAGQTPSPPLWTGLTPATARPLPRCREILPRSSPLRAVSQHPD
jgi:hypothetical protein